MKRRLAFIIIPLLILLVALGGGFDVVWRFFVFVVVVLLLSYLWAHLSVRGVYGSAEISTDLVRVGQHYEADFSVANHGRLPIALLQVSELTDLPGYRNEVSVSLGGHGEHRWHRRIYCRRRGRYRVGGLNFRATDPLGLFPVERRVDRRQEITIYPATLELPFFSLSPQPESGAAARRWLASQASPNAASVRDYVSGDPLRHIHWPTTAHTGGLMVREFDPDPPRDTTLREIWIILDMQRHSRLGEGDETTEEYGVTIAASLAKKYLDGGKRVGLLAEGDTACLVPPDGGHGQMEAILQALTPLKATGSVPINDLLTDSAERFGAGAAAIIVMPSENPAIAAPLGQITGRRARAAVILLDSFSFGGSASSTNNARILGAAGASVYTVHQGTPIEAELDSRRLPASLQLVGGVM